MTIPNVYINWCQHKAKCHYCPNQIVAGNPMVTVFFWNKGTENGHKWNVKQYYHPQCWVDQGLDYLKMNPYVPRVGHVAGKRWNLTTKSRNPITEEQRKHRYVLLRRKCSLDQRKRNLKADYPDRLLVEARIDQQIVNLMMEIAEYGGIPPRWIDSLT